MNSKILYFDNNSTHVPIREVLEKSVSEYIENYCNPSGATKCSLKAQGKIEDARKFFGNITGKNPSGIVFNSTGTESNFLLISAIAAILPEKKIITSSFEHPSVYGALEFFGFEQIHLQTDKSGVIDLNDLERKIRLHKVPVLLIYASNETGVIQPIHEVHQLTQKYDVSFFSDMMQAFGKIDILYSLFDGFTFSGHKIGAGMGSSLSFLEPTHFTQKQFAIFRGGNQENGFRAGTENCQSILSFQYAAQFQIDHLQEKNERLTQFQKTIEKELKNLDVQIVAENSKRLPSTTFAILPLDDIDFFMIGLENKNIILSNGASCKSRTRTPSESLLSMGYTKEEALRAIRISTGFFTSTEEVESLIDGIKEILQKLKMKI